MVVVAFGQENGLVVTTPFPMGFEIIFEVRVITNGVNNSQALMLPCELETSSAARLLLLSSLPCKYGKIAGNRNKN